MKLRVGNWTTESAREIFHSLKVQSKGLLECSSRFKVFLSVQTCGLYKGRAIGK